ncbi:Squalene synthase [hydrothermal vent metagenome]|uniref:Squalene synthase n=1 Tax=hydrothermal vent metagenome TaxID=652676 RepID=A0A3B1BQJ0_9ZZZZ
MVVNVLCAYDRDMSALEQAYQHCQCVTAAHYENFPVASHLLPKKLRRPISVIYTFARSADDFADEGDFSKAQRHEKLDDYSAKLNTIENAGAINDPVFIALADVIKKHALPLSLFHDLLTAFKMDVDKTRFADFAEILNYCHYSANPVGRLLLHLNNTASPQNLIQSDAVCSALQLINFYQDLQQDYQENDRIYLPQDEMQQFKVSEHHLQQTCSDAAMQALMDLQLQRATALLQKGHSLGNRQTGRFGLELRMMIHGGAHVLASLREHRGNVFRRPRLSKSAILQIAFKALFRISV